MTATNPPTDEDPFDIGSVPYIHPCDNIFTDRYLYREQYLRRFSSYFRDDPDWITKLDNDPSYFFAKFDRARELDKFLEGLNGGAAVWSRDDAEFVWMELVGRYKPFTVESRKNGKGVEPGIDGVWKAFGMVEEEVRREMVEAAKTLPDIPEERKRLQQYDNDMTWDSVNPSLWPIIYGRTIDSNGEIIQPPAIAGPPPTTHLTESHLGRPSITKQYSHKFCWLPSEFEISNDGKVKIASYINNLAMQNQQDLFYPILKRIFEGFVPLFNHVLADLREGRSDMRRVVWDDEYWPGMVSEMSKFRNEHEEKSKADWEIFSESFEWLPFIPPGKGPDDIYIRNPQERLANMWAPPHPETLENVKLEGRTVKVIVRMMDAMVTSKAPWFTGGGWRVEGVKNESIIASGIYCYEQENVSEFGLSFRQPFSGSHDDPSLDYGDKEAPFYGIDHNMACQEIGNVELREGQGIAFPNIFHYRMWACCRLDESKPGHVKLLQFLLCDPSGVDIPTTRTVPVQQPEAREEKINAFRERCVGRLPMELIYEIEQYIPPAIPEEEAKEYCQKIKEDGLEWMECIIKMGGNASYYSWSKPAGAPFEMICTLSTFRWTWFTPRQLG
ncbi:hypothetical protein TWF718_001867 [Orbilia javanica]|uniref:DUF4246 domain-containing protein n=1 Tax=Orbilia javanica TaxID=47235 RepID=A0AAN8NII2_9PEZI